MLKAVSLNKAKNNGTNPELKFIPPSTPGHTVAVITSAFHNFLAPIMFRHFGHLSISICMGMITSGVCS